MHTEATGASDQPSIKSVVWKSLAYGILDRADKQD